MRQFRELKIGVRFEFPHVPYSGMKTGVCVKISARRYRYESDGMVCTVGSVTAQVKIVV